MRKTEAWWGGPQGMPAPDVIDLTKIYRDPLGGDVPVADLDVMMRRGKLEEDLRRAVSTLAAAGAVLNGYAGRREIGADPYWKRWVSLIRDARLQATRACDELLAAIGEDVPS